jgi:hypothetical protein
MKFGPFLRVASVALVCVLILIGVVITEGIARRGGQEVLLAMEAVDPRSILSGHYVAIDIAERLEPGQHCPPEQNEAWVALTRRGGEIYGVAGGATSRERAQLVGPLPVKATFTCQEPIEEAPGIEPFPGSIRLDLNIDRFHINQADALRIEGILRDQTFDNPTRAYAIVSVGRDGRARLKGVQIDGERLELSWL